LPRGVMGRAFGSAQFWDLFMILIALITEA
jgi:hypothetical protein